MASAAVSKGAAKTVVSISKKHTQGSTGIWEVIRRALAVDPDRSNGIPVKDFRNPPPGSVDPTAYDDPVTLPAGDIADNPYWKRDVRRSYPRLSSVSQSHAVALLSLGSAASPSPLLAAGPEGANQLVAAQEQAGGLGAFFAANPHRAAGAGAVAVAPATAEGQNVSVSALPPFPVSTSRRKAKLDSQKYELAEEQSYQYK
ncbi:hypothetical protein DV738_g2817, partial [Chaetothyriales sp. CBS 135597]